MTNREQLFEYVKNYKSEGRSVLDINSDLIVYLFDNCEFEFLPDNAFFVNVDCGNVICQLHTVRSGSAREKIAELGLHPGYVTKAFTGACDFGHTSAGWEDVLSLGIWGLRERAKDFLSKTTDEKSIGFYTNIIRIYDSAFRFIFRVIDKAKAKGYIRMAESLSNLTKRPPETLYEAMQTSLVYYILQQKFDGSILRTMGRIDSLFYPFYLKCDEAERDELVIRYMEAMESYHVGSNLPFALGGTDAEGKDLINELSYKLLRAYHKLDTKDVKFHLIVSENTPEDIIRETFEGIRTGKNSVVFMNNRKVIDSLVFNGATKEDATNFHIVGCYECGAEGELTCSCNARVNVPKAVEYALFGGYDTMADVSVGLSNNGKFDTFEEFYNEYTRQLRHLSKCAMLNCDAYEKRYPEIFAGPILSSTYKSAMENGRDVYHGFGAKYNNSSVNAIGIATAADSLYAIKKLVYDDKEYTLDEIREILESNWKDNETLRFKIKNKFPKYGQGIDDVDKLAADTVDVLSDEISNKPNQKGGVYRLGTFSINWRHEFGEHTLASADGRYSGETISQNMSPSFGADKEGVTAYITSASKIDASKTPNGTVIDLDFHSSAVRGKEGLDSMVATLKTYFEKGGFAVHYNVLDTDTLLDAKVNPEKYPNLQVRLCGWNVLFANLSDKEKDEFIYRSQK